MCTRRSESCHRAYRIVAHIFLLSAPRKHTLGSQRVPLLPSLPRSRGARVSLAFCSSCACWSCLQSVSFFIVCRDRRLCCSIPHVHVRGCPQTKRHTQRATLHNNVALHSQVLTAKHAPRRHALCSTSPGHRLGRQPRRHSAGFSTCTSISARVSFSSTRPPLRHDHPP